MDGFGVTGKLFLDLDGGFRRVHLIHLAINVFH